MGRRSKEYYKAGRKNLDKKFKKRNSEDPTKEKKAKNVTKDYRK